MSLSLPPNSTFEFGNGLITYNGVELQGIWWPFHTFQLLFKDLRPKTLEDFKALVWMYGGPRPSDTENVEMKTNDNGKMIVLIITPRAPNGLQPIEAINRESTSSS